jgi:hypothetical protein
MRPLLMLLATVVVLLPVPVAGVQPTESSGSSVIPTACDEMAGESGSEALATSVVTPAAGLPSGLTLVVLTDQPTEHWPLRASGLILTLRHLDLDPGAASASRRADGPLLFYVETGSVGISINSLMTYYEAGAGVLVQRGQRYVLRNASEAPASMLRVEVVAPGEETEVAIGDPVDVHKVDRESPPGPPFIASRLLLTGEIPAIEGKTHLILGCLSWTDPAADPGDITHPGPVGYLVVRGQMLVGETASRVAGECVGFQARRPHRLRAGNPPPVVLVVTAMPDGSQLWTAENIGEGSEASTNRLRFACGEQEDANFENGSTTAVGNDP